MGEDGPAPLGVPGPTTRRPRLTEPRRPAAERQHSRRGFGEDIHGQRRASTKPHHLSHRHHPHLFLISPYLSPPPPPSPSLALSGVHLTAECSGSLTQLLSAVSAWPSTSFSLPSLVRHLPPH